MTKVRVRRGDSLERYVRRTRRLERLAQVLGVLLAVGMIALAFALAGCGGPTSGTVVQRQYIEGHYDYYLTTYCSAHVTHFHTSTYRSNGRTYTRTYTTSDCVAYGTIPHRRWVSDRWGLRLQDDQGHLGYVYVGLSTYEACAVGQHYEKGRCT